MVQTRESERLDRESERLDRDSDDKKADRPENKDISKVEGWDLVPDWIQGKRRYRQIMQTVTSKDGDENQGWLAGTSVPSPVLQQTGCWTRKTTLPPEFPYERKGLTGKSQVSSSLNILLFKLFPPS